MIGSGFWIFALVRVLPAAGMAIAAWAASRSIGIRDRLETGCALL